MLDLRVCENPPDGNWVERLRKGHWVWLVKEKEFAQIRMPYQPVPGGRCGNIALDRVSNNWFRGTQVWYVGLRGEGIDGNPLLKPVEGNLPDNPEPLPEPEIRNLQREIEKLQERVNRLESQNRLFGLPASLHQPSRLGELLGWAESDCEYPHTGDPG